jgi:cytochrome P450
MAVPKKRLPPGPAAAYTSEVSLLDWIRDQSARFGDIFHASIYGINCYVVSNPSLVEHVLLKNWQNYIKGHAIKRIALLLGKGLMVSEGDFWISQRRMIQPAFHRNIITGLSTMIASANEELLKCWTVAARAGSSVNVTRDLSRTVLDIVLRSIFGEDYVEMAPRFSVLTEHAERSLEFADAFRPLAQAVIQLAARRRGAARSCHDVLGMLMEARDRETGSVMPERQLAREIMTLVVAGHETTASVLNWTWYLLSQHPEAERRLSAEIRDLSIHAVGDVNDLPKFTYTRQVLEEAMRLYPPGWLLTRKAIGDDDLGGYFVPAGTELYISPFLIHRHPALWDDPDRFDPDRFAPEACERRHPLAMLAFSAGPRNCIGEFYARIEMQIHLMIVARRITMHHADAQPPEMTGGVNLLSRQDIFMTPRIKNQ